MTRTTLNTIYILAITLVVVAGVVLYIRNQQLNAEIDTLVEKGGYSYEENDNN